MKSIHVVCAVIRDGDRIFCTQRGYGEYKDGWEFPGGKVEIGESGEEAIVREIREELDTVIRVVGYVDTVEYEYPSFHLVMDCYMCEVVSGSLTLLEHEACRWVNKTTIDSVDWLPADRCLIDAIKKLM